MGVKSSVFASKAEKANFERLRKVWGSRYQLYHNLPFLHVYTLVDLLDPESCEPLTLSFPDEQRLKKTSIDYVLCDANDKPLICIEFDGMVDSFSAGGKYVHEGYCDLWRDTIMSLKLKVSRASELCSPKAVPYVIVSSNEFKDLSPRIKLTLVDGIIGELLASRACAELFSGGFDPEYVGVTQEDFDDLSDAEKSDLIGDWVMANEVAFEAEHSQIFRANCKLRRMLEERGIFEHGFSIEYLAYPPVPDDLSPRERMALIDSAIRVGIRYRFYFVHLLPGETVTFTGANHLDICQSVWRTVWMPNLHYLGIGYNLQQEIGRMLCQMKLKESYEPLVPQ